MVGKAGGDTRDPTLFPTEKESKGMRENTQPYSFSTKLTERAPFRYLSRCWFYIENVFYCTKLHLNGLVCSGSTNIGENVIGSENVHIFQQQREKEIFVCALQTRGKRAKKTVFQVIIGYLMYLSNFKENVW